MRKLNKPSAKAKMDALYGMHRSARDVWMERLLMVVTTASVVAGVWQLLATTQQDIFDLDMLAAMQSGPTGCRRAWGAS